MASIISAGTTSATALNMSADTSGVLQLASNNGTVGLTMDTSQNVGIGTSSPDAKLTIKNPNVSGAQTVMTVLGATSSVDLFALTANQTTDVIGLGTNYAGALAFNTNSTERMRITSAGAVGIGTTSPTGALTVAGVNCDTYLSGSNAVRLFLNGPASTWAISSNYYYTGGIAFTNSGTGVFTLPQAGGFGVYTNTPTGLGSQTGASNVSTINQSGLTLTQYGVTAGFYYDRLNFTNSQYYVVNASSVGVYLGNGSTSWSSTSDERLKNVTGTYTDALGDITKIKPVKFTWKADEANKPQVGVIAQSVLDVVPEAIDSATLGNEGDDIKYLSVRYTELVPLLIASIQELNKKVTDLEEQVLNLGVK